jgi:hypothetical protein
VSHQLLHLADQVALVGDPGVDDAHELEVADMVHTWLPDEVLALGDLNYDTGLNSTIDARVGKYYGRYIYPFKGSALYGTGSATQTNRYWPIPGNHDWGNTCGDSNSGCSCTSNLARVAPYIWYMPTNGRRYYNTVLGGGLVEIFALSSDCNEPDGTTSTSVQGQWLKTQLAASTATWKLVLIHHSPFSSGTSHGSNPRTQW